MGVLFLVRDYVFLVKH